MTVVVVIGVGNAYRGDDGVGLAVAERLRGRVPAGVDGRRRASRSRARLLDAWEGADRALVVDAVVVGRARRARCTASTRATSRVPGARLPLARRTRSAWARRSSSRARSAGCPAASSSTASRATTFAAGEGLTPGRRGRGRAAGRLNDRSRRRRDARARADATTSCAKIEEVARAEGATRVTQRRACGSARSPTSRRSTSASTSTTRRAARSPRARRSTPSLDDDIDRRRARDVVLESVEVEPRAGRGVLMCLGSIAVLDEAWDDGGARVGRLDDGSRRLARVRSRRAGRRLSARAPRHPGRGARSRQPPARRSRFADRRRSRDDARRADRASRSRSSTAVVSGVSVYVNGHGVTHFGDATVYTTAKNARRRRAPRSRSPLVARRGRRRAPRPRRPRGRAAVARRSSPSPCIGGSVPFVLFFEGLSRAEATQAAFIQKTLVVWVALLAVPLLRERFGPPHALAIALLVAGQAWLAAAPARSRSARARR